MKRFKYLLYPFSVLYGLGVRIRNGLYDKKIWHSASFNIPLICVGNLTVGGTGKTPMIEYLTELLNHHHKVAILSRGYKRKTKGFAIADEQSTAMTIGDEPMQIHLKFPAVPVAVAEERVIGIPQLLQERPDTDVILLDDAFQHRAVNADLNILLTDYKNLYTRDIFLPVGTLRDSRRSSLRAHIIVVSKCPDTLSEEEREKILREINPGSHQMVFFTAIRYGIPYHLFDLTPRMPNKESEVLLLSGIANPDPLKQAVKGIAASYEWMEYSDHHIFNRRDLKELKSRFERMPGENKMILTTEKDGVRLQRFRDEIAALPIFVWPVKHRFLLNGASSFVQRITDFIKSFSQKE